MPGMHADIRWSLQHEIVALSGENGRHVFFHDKNLDINEGYRLLMGGVSPLDGTTHCEAYLF